MKKLFGFGILALSGLLLASCQVGLVSYGHGSGWHRDGRGDRGRGMHRYVVVAVASPQQQSQELSQDYGIKYDSAATIIGLVNSADPTRDLAALNLQQEDIAPLAKLQMPSDDSVHRVALSLNESDSTVSLLMQDYIADMRSQTRTRDLK